MIERYTRAEMGEVWTERARYLNWLFVELAVCEELAKRKKIPRKDWIELQSQATKLIKKGGVDPRRVSAHEAVTRHDVIAFTTALTEAMGPTARHIHFGLTSSDVVDTALSLQVQQAGEVLLKGIEGLSKELLRLAKVHKKTATIGRSHVVQPKETSTRTLS